MKYYVVYDVLIALPHNNINLYMGIIDESRNVADGIQGRICAVQSMILQIENKKYYNMGNMHNWGSI